MNKRLLTVISAYAALPVVLLQADQVVLSNGDRISGAILDTTKDKITVKTEFLGEVTIDRKGIVSITADQPLIVTLESGEKVEGVVTTEGSQVRVRKADRSETMAPLDTLEAVRTEEFQRKWERERQRQTNPGLLDFWRGTIDLGLATAQGNADTTTVSTGADVVRRTGFDKISLAFAQIYSTQRTREPFGKTANRISGGARYDRDFGSRAFAYGGTAFDFDEFQDLDLRSVLGAGLGWHIIARDRHWWDFTAGGNWNREKFSTGLVRNSGELALGEKSEHQISRLLKVFQGMTVLPNLSQTGEYRLSLDAGTDLKLNSFISWTFVASDRFLSNPIGGNKKNDLLITTGLKFSFEQR
ncbi:MAG: DUF481 domain-containing protein [Bryobacteraceae bacterium]|nr:DUF481 domain-containing protein [Bryobacteraceae bacterium]